MYEDSGTDTDTESSYGEAVYDYSDVVNLTNEDERQAQLYWTYKQHNGRFRRYMRKPVRKIRRFFRSVSKGKGKRKGKRVTGKGITYYVENLGDEEYDQMFFAGKGKSSGKGKRSSGKGKGRKGNPRGKDGNVMKCHTCGDKTTS